MKSKFLSIIFLIVVFGFSCEGTPAFYYNKFKITSSLYKNRLNKPIHIDDFYKYFEKIDPISTVKTDKIIFKSEFPHTSKKI